MLGLTGLIAAVLFLAPAFRLIQVSANFSNLPAMVIPLAVIYLNRQLPRPARLKWWSYIVLILNMVFFGYFFVNFVASDDLFKPARDFWVSGILQQAVVLGLSVVLIGGLVFAIRRSVRRTPRPT